jgi:hypothetical protein
MGTRPRWRTSFTPTTQWWTWPSLAYVEFGEQVKAIVETRSPVTA